MDKSSSRYTCKFCQHPLRHVFLDLGSSPLANSFLKPEDVSQQTVTYPLNVYVCEQCLLVQLGHCVSPQEIFCDYAYFSSYSSTWLNHAKEYVAKMSQRYQLTTDRHILEIGSNDGYLLQYFHAQGFPVYGIEPAENVAHIARSKNIMTESIFFGQETARKLRQRGIFADLLIANNVLAHVPDINDFVAGIAVILTDDGIVTIEVPHLKELIENNEFDTIYHEHYFYFSLLSLQKIFSKHELIIFDVEQLGVHGGSLRVFVKKRTNNKYPIQGKVQDIIQLEKEFGLADLRTYSDFQAEVDKVRIRLIDFVEQVKRSGSRIAGYGAPAKGNTLLNYCQLNNNWIDFTVDQNPNKQNCFLPGSNIPVYHVDKIFAEKPNYLLILPWNLKDEIMQEVQTIKDWGGKFVIPIPKLQVI